MFTYFLIAAAVVLVVAVVWHQIRTRNTPGHHIGQNAAMDSNDTNRARYVRGSNVHQNGPFDTPGGL